MSQVMSDVTGHRNLHVFHIYIYTVDFYKRKYGFIFFCCKDFSENWLIYFKMIQKNAKRRKYLKNVRQTETNST